MVEIRCAARLPTQLQGLCQYQLPVDQLKLTNKACLGSEEAAGGGGFYKTVDSTSSL